MGQEFDLARNVYLDRDPAGVVRQLLHTHAPIRIDAPTSQLIAARYLQEFGGLLGITAAELTKLSVSPASSLEDTGVQYRFLEEKHQFDSATVA